MPRLRFISTVHGVNTIELTEPLITIGRSVNNVVCIEDVNISKHHTLLISEDNTYRIYDLHSVNGTCVNGERITVTSLKEGDTVRIGYLELKYEIAAPAPLRAPAVPGKLQAAPSVEIAAAPAAPTLRPRLGLGVSGKPPALAPVAAAAPPRQPIVEPPTVAAVAEPPIPAVTPPAVPSTPAKEEKRVMIRLPADKSPAPAPTSPSATVLSEPPRLKPVLRREPEPPPPALAPEPPAAAKPEPAVADQPPAAPAEQPPTTGPKKLAAPASGQPPKFRLKRE